MDSQIYNQNLAKLLRYLRRSRNLSQTDMANILSCSRNKVQRIENLKSSMNYLEWCNFSEHFKLEIHHVKNCFLESPIGNEFSEFKIPENLSSNPYSRGQTLSIHNWNLKRYFGEKAFEDFCAAEKIDPLYFINSNNSLNMDFSLRMIQQIVMKGKMTTEKEFDSFTSQIQSLPNYHLQIRNQLFAHKGAERIAYLIEKADNYELNHSFSLDHVEHSKNQFYVSITPREHVNRKLYSQDPFVNGFHKNFFKSYCYNLLEATFNVDHVKETGPFERFLLRLAKKESFR